jgi:KDO2-lipid IV(A) lauroyltransferase
LKIDKNKIEFFLFSTVARLLKRIGLEKTRRLGRLFGIFIYYFIPVRRSTAISNLRRAFPQKQKSEIRSIARKNYQSITITFFELMLMPHLSLNVIKDQVECDSLDLIKEKIEEGKGVILLTAHFGNWEFIVSSVAAKVTGSYNVLVKPQRNPYITDWLEKTRHIANTKVIPLGVSVKSVYKALNMGEVVLIAGDQRGHRDSVRFMFFNQPTALYIGAAAIADRTKCSVLMSIIERQPDLKYKLHIRELDFSNLPDNYDERIYELTKRYVSFLEIHVANSPEQYFWMHKLWKY